MKHGGNHIRHDAFGRLESALHFKQRVEINQLYAMLASEYLCLFRELTCRDHVSDPCSRADHRSQEIPQDGFAH